MTTEKSFIHAIVSDPADDLPRLAYADWLADQPSTTHCVTCDGKGKVGPNKPPTSIYYDCWACWGRGFLQHNHADRAEFIRGHVTKKRHFVYPFKWELLGDFKKLFSGSLGCSTTADGWRVTARVRREGSWSEIEMDVIGGFVESVKCSLAAFLGGPCGRCQIAGRHPDDRTGCANCHGTGCVGGVAADLFRTQPVTRVELTDRYPYQYRNIFYWSSEGWGQERSVLAEAVYALLPDNNLSSNPKSMKGFRSVGLAVDAASQKLVCYGRNLNDLPGLTEIFFRNRGNT